LFDAITKGQTGQIQDLINSNPKLASARNSVGVSAVVFSMYVGQKEAADVLLTARPELDVFAAAALGDEKTLRRLLAQDAALVNAMSPDGFSPLHLACYLGQTATAKTLIEAKAPLDKIASNGSELRPINSAAASRNLYAGFVITGALIDAG